MVAITRDQRCENDDGIEVDRQTIARLRQLSRNQKVEKEGEHNPAAACKNKYDRALQHDLSNPYRYPRSTQTDWNRTSDP